MSKKKEETSDAVAILHRRYVGDDPNRRAAIEEERIHAKVARQIYDLRTSAGMSQKELAERIGTTQSAISRLEDADYEGHSLSMLRKVAEVLGAKVDVDLDRPARRVEPFVFRTFLNFLRRSKALTLDQLAKKANVSREELAAIEHQDGYVPSQRTVHQLSRFYGLSAAKLAALAGAIDKEIGEVRGPAFRFAAQSENFSRLSSEEKKALAELAGALREDHAR